MYERNERLMFQILPTKHNYAICLNKKFMQLMILSLIITPELHSKLYMHLYKHLVASEFLFQGLAIVDTKKA